MSGKWLSHQEQLDPSKYLPFHRQVHADQLVHACKICGKRFNSEKGCAKHEEGHKSDQPDVYL